MRTGAQALCQALEAAGVRHAFGLPGTQDVELHEALRRSRITFVNTTHELAASFMANGYFRASGRLAPIFAIPGPGFTHALTGLAEAAHDSAAVLLVVGAPPPGPRRFQFQAIDQAAMAAPIVKAALRLEEASRVACQTRRAVSLALEGEPGPVLLEWTAAALSGEAPAAGRPPWRPPTAAADPGAALLRAAALLAAARRPLLLAGQGALAAAGDLAALAERLGAAVATTTSGRGALPEDHPRSLAFELARGGLAGLDALVEASDAVLVVGCKLGAGSTGDFRLTLPAAKVVRIDASQEVLEAGYPAAEALLGRAEALLPALLRRLGPGGPPNGAGWPLPAIAAWRSRLARGAAGRLPEAAVRGLDPPTAQALFGALRRALPRHAIVVTDSGQHQELARRWLDVWSPGGLMLPSDFQSMGFGLPAAIGAALAAPGRPVVAVVGDGAFAMTAMELLTAVRLRLTLTVVVLADGHLDRIRLQQLAAHGAAHGVDLRNPDFAALAAAVGASHELVAGDAEAVFGRALKRPGVTLLEVRLGDSAAIHRSRARALARSFPGVPEVRRLARWLAGRRRPADVDGAR